MPDIDPTPAVSVPPNVVSAVFGSEEDAGRAVEALRNLGVSDSAFSVVARSHEEGSPPAAESPSGAAEPQLHPGIAALDGAGVGAAVGALFGLASVAIPGVGPFITAGALAPVLGVAAGAATSGAIVGGASGALAGVIAHVGLADGDAQFYAREVERGGVYLGIDLARTALDRESVQGVLDQYSGRHPE
jgi:hypothetical protein